MRTARPRTAWCASLLAALLGATACSGPPAPGGSVAYVPDAECASCHESEREAWAGSHHDRAMQEATADTVLAGFGDITVDHGGTTTRFFRREGEFFANAVGPDGTRRDYRVRYTFGVDPLQQYLVELPGGRLQALTVAWDVVRKRWFDLYPDERPVPGDPLHWSGLYLTWNAQCADCHSTGVRKRFDATTNTYATSWAELNVGCQACHGPGTAHVAWARRTRHDSADVGLLPAFVRTDARSEVESCAPCHARRHRISGDDDVQLPFLDHYAPEPLRAGLYHVDGQIQGEVFEYGSFVQSRMYAMGVRCTDCHDPHTARLRAEGNALCVTCHNPGGNPRFPSLPRKAYDTAAHHFHPDGSPGSRCVACHMPSRFYMVVDERHDHSLRIPRPDLSEQLGTPDACTSCHTDRTTAWAATEIRRHHGDHPRPPHFGEVLAAARAGRPDAGHGLAALVSDHSRPGLLRATAVEGLPAYGPGAVRVLVGATKDPDPIVRAAAVGELDHAPDVARLAAEHLDDPVRAVRVEAARVTAAARIAPADAAALTRARAEYDAMLRAEADGPSAHLNLAVLAEARNDRATAEAEYGTALRLDPGFLPARFNLVHLLNAAGRNAEAETVLRDGIARVPGEGELHYSLGLLLAEMDRGADALAAFTRAAELLPTRARVHYNHGLALEQRGQQAAAEQAFLRARALNPADADVLRALIAHYLARGRPKDVLPLARELARLEPDAPGVAELLRSLEGDAR